MAEVKGLSSGIMQFQMNKRTSTIAPSEFAFLRGGEEWFFFGLMKVHRSVASQIALGSDGARLFMRPEMSPNSNPGVSGAAPRHVRNKLLRTLRPGRISDGAK
jgi:hypothetical protein